MVLMLMMMMMMCFDIHDYDTMMMMMMMMILIMILMMVGAGTEDWSWPPFWFPPLEEGVRTNFRHLDPVWEREMERVNRRSNTPQDPWRGRRINTMRRDSIEYAAV